MGELAIGFHGAGGGELVFGASLELKSERTVGLITATDSSHGSVSTLNSLEAGGYTLEKPIVVVRDMSAAIQAADPNIRGVLGENFLAHFDVLIDYRRGLLCLDQAKLMEKDLRGERVPLVTSNHSQTEMAFFPRLVSRQTHRYRKQADPAAVGFRQ